MPDPATLARLEADGLVVREGGAPRTTRRFQGALARAALRLAREGAPWAGLRLPIAVALVELCGDLPDAELAERVEALAELEGKPPFWEGERAS